MKFYSELTHSCYDTEEGCVAAEEDYKKAVADKKEKEKATAEKRKKMAQEISVAYDEYRKALQKYEELRNAFVKQFGSYHMTITDSSMKTPFSIFEDFFTF